MIDQGQARDRYEQLASSRNEITARAERASVLTLPSLMPKAGHSEGSNLPTPYQSLGAKAVNTLSAKILLALFPPNTSFFKLGLDEIAEAEAADQVDKDKVAHQLSLIEKTTVGELEQTKLRSTIALVAKHLIVTGNAVLDVMPSRNFRMFGLTHFVVNRDPEGVVLELIIKETVSPLTLSETVQAAVFDQQEITEFSTSPDKTVDVFTVMQRDGKKYSVFQEIETKLVPGSTGDYPLEAPRFVVLRWSAVTDEDYGRGMVDEYYGDLKALDDLSRDLLVASAAAAKVIFAVDPNSHITPKMLEGAKSGDVLKGEADDVKTINIDKLHDFQIVLDRLRDIKTDLAESFLMNSTVQRDAERVTAEEVRFIAQELEDALGGVYSVLAQELQVPLTRRFLSLLGQKKLIPKLPVEGIRLSITTGLEALGRGHEVNKLLQFIDAAKNMVGEQEMLQRLDVRSILNQLAAGLGMDTDGVVLSEEEYAAKIAQMQQQAIAGAAAPGVIQEAVKQGGQPNG